MTKILLSLALRVLPTASVESVWAEYDAREQARVSTVRMADGSEIIGWQGGSCSDGTCLRVFSADGRVLFSEGRSVWAD